MIPIILILLKNKNHFILQIVLLKGIKRKDDNYAGYTFNRDIENIKDSFVQALEVLEAVEKASANKKVKEIITDSNDLYKINEEKNDNSNINIKKNENINKNNNNINNINYNIIKTQQGNNNKEIRITNNNANKKNNNIVLNIPKNHKNNNGDISNKNSNNNIIKPNNNNINHTKNGDSNISQNVNSLKNKEKEKVKNNNNKSKEKENKVITLKNKSKEKSNKILLINKNKEKENKLINCLSKSKEKDSNKLIILNKSKGKDNKLNTTSNKIKGREIINESKKDSSLLKHLNTTNKTAINKNIKEIKKGNISPNPAKGIAKKKILVTNPKQKQGTVIKISPDKMQREKISSAKVRITQINNQSQRPIKTATIKKEKSPKEVNKK